MNAAPVPPSLSPPGDDEATQTAPGLASFNRFVTWGLTLLLLLLLALVILVLPGQLEQSEPEEAARLLHISQFEWRVPFAFATLKSMVVPEQLQQGQQPVGHPPMGTQVWT